MKFPCFYIDNNLLGIIVSSFIMSFCFIVSCLEAREQQRLSCNSIPEFFFSKDPSEFHLKIAEEINKSFKEIYIAAYNISFSNINQFYLSALKSAKNKGVSISILIPEDYCNSSISFFNNHSIANVYCANNSMGVAIIDNNAYLFNDIFSDTNNHYSLLTSFNHCEIAVQDIKSFFLFQILRIANKLSKIVSITHHAKSSLIWPFYLPSKSGEDKSSTFYFFHNPAKYGDPLRISTYDLIQSTVYFNSNTAPKKNISLFASKIPPYTDLIYSFYQVFTRVVMNNQEHHNDIFFRYLVPQSQNTSENWWMKTTAALQNTEIRLYDDSLIGSNYMIIDNRAFVFSHPIDDSIVNENLGFHYSTNSSDIVKVLQDHFDDIFMNDSQPFIIVS